MDLRQAMLCPEAKLTMRWGTSGTTPVETSW
jgi:hypothetical protein